MVRQIVGGKFGPGAKGLMVKSTSEDILERSEVSGLQYRRRQKQKGNAARLKQ